MVLERKLRIMIVDDNVDFCYIISEFIDMQPDMETIGVAYDGKAALGMILKERPDVVIVDIVMPIFDGMRVIKEVNAALEHKPRYILVSAGSIDYSIKRAMWQEDIEFMMKPMNLDILIAKIRSFSEQGAEK